MTPWSWRRELGIAGGALAFGLMFGRWPGPRVLWAVVGGFGLYWIGAPLAGTRGRLPYAVLAAGLAAGLYALLTMRIP